MASTNKKIELNKLTIDRTSHQPLYAQINEQLCKLIDQFFLPGDAFYSEQAITRALGVSRITIRRVIDDMDREGRVIRQPGRKALVAGGSLRRYDSTSRMAKYSTSYVVRKYHIRSIVLVGLTWKSEFVLDVVDKLTNACKLRGLEVRVRMIAPDELDSFTAGIHGRPEDEAYLLFVGSRLGKSLYNNLRSRGFRTVAIDTMSEGYDGDSVSTDVHHAVQISVRHLADLGHKKIVLLVNEPIIHESVIQKLIEFSRLTIELGLAGRIVIASGPPGIESHDAAYNNMAEVWADGELRPTAIITVSDPGAWGVQKWLRERGINIPDDVSVVGFEDARSSSHVTPPLTTAAHPVSELVERAVDMLTSDSSDADCPQLTELIKPKLVVRQSTGPAPS